MVRYLEAGESHGKGLVAIVEGLPAGIPVDVAFINRQLARRQGGYGRGGRMKIEKDQVEIITGVRDGKTLGSPVTLMIYNRDWANWEEIMSAEPGAATDRRTVTLPRPGHADLTGGIKYNHQDLRNILERASARETAIRVAVGALAQNVLQQFGVALWSHVVSIGSVEALPDYERLNDALYETPVYCTDAEAEKDMIRIIDAAKEQGDTLGGVVEVVVQGLPMGIGSYVHYDRKLDGRLAQAVMSIQAFKGVEIGLGFQAATVPGSQAHDEIFYEAGRGFYHKTNRCGGLEGSMTNGEAVVVRGAMKPIPTLYQPLHSADFLTHQEGMASVERSDACAVPAAAIVMQNAVAWTILESFLEKFGGDNLDEVKRNYNSYLEYVKAVMQ
ncbi:MAG: chorismate synthase [Peptococcaceae bacterium]